MVYLVGQDREDDAMTLELRHLSSELHAPFYRPVDVKRIDTQQRLEYGKPPCRLST
ncbi:hypothetical protein [Sorangium sp. So ce176]|uniref:hypothetical protein n=1 Tax=Sorangium sp. So ce176 TaxID=3133286 RepID=UPI003F5F7B8E